MSFNNIKQHSNSGSANKTRKEYLSPTITSILLDNEISLQLESTPPIGPYEGRLMMPENFSDDPLRNTFA